jgi:outer membrane protein assembly factor BamB
VYKKLSTMRGAEVREDNTLGYKRSPGRREQINLLAGWKGLGRRTMTIRFRKRSVAMNRSLAIVLILTCSLPCMAEDWPMWRADASRTGEWSGTLEDELELHWVRQYPRPVPAYDNPRLQFDDGYEPVVQAGMMYFGSSVHDRVTALDVETGEEKWHFHAEGPVRVAPVVWRDRLFFGSDDGHLYCLRSDNGQLIWKYRAVPSRRMVLGNGRMISVWPVRGGPVIADDVLYFAAGVWSFEGTFVQALNPDSGEVIWVNDRTSHLYGQHPHDAKAFGGLVPQGYLIVDGNELIVPCGTALPARFDRHTGELRHFELPKPGRVPGGWFATVSAAKRRGLPVPEEERLLFDSQVNRHRHEGGWHEGRGDDGVRSTVSLNGSEFRFADGYPGVTGTIHSILAAKGRLFVVTKEGEFYCFGSKGSAPSSGNFDEATTATTATTPDEPASDGGVGAKTEESASDEPNRDVQRLLGPSEGQFGRFGNLGGFGYGVVFGAPDDDSLVELAKKSNMHWIVLESNPERCAAIRRELDDHGLLGSRMAVQCREPSQVSLPPYFANLALVGDLDRAGFRPTDGSDFVRHVFEVLRPHGGMAAISISAEYKEAVRNALDEAELESATWKFVEKGVLLTRVGELPGAQNYTGGWESPDERVRAPLGLLWHDDRLSHFKRAPQPMIVDGVMISYDKDWLGWVDGLRPPYALLPPTYSDIYTGRVFTEQEVQRIAQDLPTRDITEKQQEQYRPPTQTNAWKPEAPMIGTRINPLTGATEPRAIPKSYGCDGGIDYGLFYTLRSGTAAFYDKTLESGTIHISGPRSGCTNSVIPAGGILNVPYFFDGCSCSYPLPSGLALISMPPEHEQWAVWGEASAENAGQAIRRLGVNFGAPGARMSPEGTLWLDQPLVGGPAPQLNTRTIPSDPDHYYHHSVWMRGGVGWPWVAASGVRGISQFSLEGLARGNFTLRLYFADPDHRAAGERVLDVLLDDKPLLTGLDIAAESGGSMRSLVKEFPSVPIDGSLRLRFRAQVGEPIISGLELVQEEVGLQLDPLGALPDRIIPQLDVPPETE